jgi:hypothetical protein
VGQRMVSTVKFKLGESLLVVSEPKGSGGVSVGVIKVIRLQMFSAVSIFWAVSGR